MGKKSKRSAEAIKRRRAKSKQRQKMKKSRLSGYSAHQRWLQEQYERASKKSSRTRLRPGETPLPPLLGLNRQKAMNQTFYNQPL